MTRTEFSKPTKRAALERSGYKCEAAGPRYGFEEGQRCNCNLSLGVQFDHAVPDALGGDTSLENCMAVCVQCHRFKTRNDVGQIAKMKRQKDRHTGVSRPSGKLKSAPFPKTEKAMKRQAKASLPPRQLYEASHDR